MTFGCSRRIRTSSPGYEPGMLPLHHHCDINQSTSFYTNISSLVSISSFAVRALNFFCTIIITDFSEKVKIRRYEIFKERKGLVCPRCQASLRFVVGRRRRTWTATPHPKCGVLPLHHVLYIGTLYGARTHILSLRGIFPNLLEEQSITGHVVLRCRTRTDNFSVEGKCLNLLTNHQLDCCQCPYVTFMTTAECVAITSPVVVTPHHRNIGAIHGIRTRTASLEDWSANRWTPVPHIAGGTTL